jgi:hypothetical protein
MDMYCHIRYEGGSRNLVRLSANRVCSRRVSEPGRPSPMGERIDPIDRHDFHAGIGQKAFLRSLEVSEVIVTFPDGYPFLLREGHDDGSRDAVQDAAVQGRGMEGFAGDEKRDC